MFWYIVLKVLAIIFALVAFGAVVVFILCGCEEAEILLITLAAGVIAFGLYFGAAQIEKANTTIHTEVVEMEVGECYMTDVKMASGMVETNCYIEVGNKYIIEVPFEEFPSFNEKDTVLVEVETKTTFGETTETASLFEGD